MDPAIGRGFNAPDMISNAPGVAVISDALWRQRFSSDPNILGRAITLGNQPFSIIGVARPEFRLDAKVDVWMPLPIVESPKDQSHEYNFVARLRPGVTRPQAEADLKDVLLQLKNTYPAFGTGLNRTARLISMTPWSAIFALRWKFSWAPWRWSW